MEKVDALTISIDGRPMLDGVRLLRSLASYKVAKVANDLLVFSMFESLGDYILGSLGDIVTYFPAYRVLVSGNLISGNAILRHRLEHRAGNFLFFGLEG